MLEWMPDHIFRHHWSQTKEFVTRKTAASGGPHAWTLAIISAMRINCSPHAYPPPDGLATHQLWHSRNCCDTMLATCKTCAGQAHRLMLGLLVAGRQHDRTMLVPVQEARQPVSASVALQWPQHCYNANFGLAQYSNVDGHTDRPCKSATALTFDRSFQGIAAT